MEKMDHLMAEKITKIIKTTKKILNRNNRNLLRDNKRAFVTLEIFICDTYGWYSDLTVLL